MTWSMKINMYYTTEFIGCSSKHLHNQAESTKQYTSYNFNNSFSNLKTVVAVNGKTIWKYLNK